VTAARGFLHFPRTHRCSRPPAFFRFPWRLVGHLRRFFMDFNCGIYEIVAPSGRKYIGQSSNIRKRWNEHRRDLNAGRHHCAGLQNAWDKYGASAFLFCKIAFVPVSDLNMREQEQFDSHSWTMLYNSATCAEAPARGRICSPEQRRKMSLSHMGQKCPKSPEQRAKLSVALMGRPLDARRRELITGANNPRSRAVICIENGMRFDGLRVAVRWLRENGFPTASHGCIGRVCSGEKRIAYGFRWKYADNP
jgi:group I intron endonuclease